MERAGAGGVGDHPVIARRPHTTSPAARARSMAIPTPANTAGTPSRACAVLPGLAWIAPASAVGCPAGPLATTFAATPIVADASLGVGVLVGATVGVGGFAIVGAA